jgi:hypothetical protein
VKKLYFSTQLMSFLFCVQVKAKDDCPPAEETNVSISSQTILGFSGEEAIASIFANSIVPLT